MPRNDALIFCRAYRYYPLKLPGYKQEHTYIYGTIICIHVCLYIYIYIYIERERDVSGSPCVFVDGWRKKEFYLPYLWMASDCLEDIPLSVYFGVKIKQRAVFTWSHVILHEGQWPEVGGGKDLGRFSVKSRTQGLAVGEKEREPREKGLKQLEGNTWSVKAITKQRPGSDRRDGSAFLVTA